MAGEQQNGTPQQGSRTRTAEVEMAGDGNSSVDLANNKVTLEGGQSASLEFDQRTGKVAGAPEDKGEPAAPTEGAEGEPTDDRPQDATVTEAEAPLPDFDPANEELRTQYDTRYFNEEGKLNLATLTKEFWSNAKEGKPGTLHEGTYKYLEAQMGLSKDAVQTIEQGLVARQRESNNVFFNKVGGRQRWEAALAWGKQNYTAEQRERFNAVLAGSDPIARDEAVDALMARYGRVSPAPTRRGPPRRGAAPERSVSAQAAPGASNGGGGGSVPYATREAYTEAFSKAAAAERNAKTPAERRAAEQAREKVRQDGRASQKSWK